MPKQLTSLLVLALAIPVLAQEKSPADLKAIAEESMTKAEVKAPRTVETDNFVIATSLPEAKAKTIGESVEKTYAKAVAALKFEKSELAGGKIILYIFPDLDNYRQFKRSVIKKRAEDNETSSYDMSGDVKFIAFAPRRSDKSPNFDALASEEISKAMLTKKGGPARITEWMKDGFARAVAGRMSPSAISADRTVARRVAYPVRKGAKAWTAVDKAWNGMGRDKEALAATFMDFMAFGGGADKLTAFLGGLTPTEEVQEPNVDSAVKVAGWAMLEDLDFAFRDWLAKGSPEFKPTPEPKGKK